MSRFQRKTAIATILLSSLLAIGCVPTVVATVVSGSILSDASADAYLGQIQALRLNTGLSQEEFDQEMWEYIPQEYSEILVNRISAFAKAYAQPKIKKQRNRLDVALRDFPELRADYDDIRRKRAAHKDRQILWDLNAMMYRAIRLRDGATEAAIIEELRQWNFQFDHRYKKQLEHSSE